MWNKSSFLLYQTYFRGFCWLWMVRSYFCTPQHFIHLQNNYLHNHHNYNVLFTPIFLNWSWQSKIIKGFFFLYQTYFHFFCWLCMVQSFICLSIYRIITCTSNTIKSSQDEDTNFGQVESANFSAKCGFITKVVSKNSWAETHFWWIELIFVLKNYFPKRFKAKKLVLEYKNRCWKWFRIQNVQ